MEATEIIKKLNLIPHEMEGGYYRETYRSTDIIQKEALPDRYQKNKAACTAIYFLLTSDNFSMMHRLPTDEIFHFYMGDPIEMLVLEEGTRGEMISIGNDLETSVPQYVVKKGNLF